MKKSAAKRFAKALARQRVASGMKFLDANKPEWRDEIDLDELDLECARNCILGQVFGDYTSGLETIGIYEDDRIAQRLGFHESKKVSAELLTRCWKKAIKQTQKVQECEEACC